MAKPRHKRSLLKKTFLILMILLFPAACSGQIAGAVEFVSCKNGENPTPIEEEFKFPGDLLFMRSDRSEILAFNGETHELTTIFQTQSDGFNDISPLSLDGKTLVISHQDSPEMKTLSISLLSNHGTIQTREILLPAREQDRDKSRTWFSVDWANSNYLQGVLYDRGNIEDEMWESWLLNPYLLEWKSLSSINNGLEQAVKSGFSISPDLTRVVYVNKQYQLILYDLIQNKSLWEYSDYDGVSPLLTSPNLSNAIWSANGEKLALPITRNEGKTPGILIVNRNGRIINSIFFDDYQLGLNWSIDGQLLAFYENRSTNLDNAGNLKSIIRTINMKDGLLRDLCSLGEKIEPSQGIENNRIVWSPDQQFLAYSSWSNNEILRDGIIIQKLSDPQVRIIQVDTDTMILLGWSEYHWLKASP